MGGKEADKPDNLVENAWSISYHNFMAKHILLILPLLLTSIVWAADSKFTLDNYSSGISANWQPKIFKGLTSYTLATVDGQRCIAAESNGAASGLIYKIKYSPEKYPILTWKWRIDHILNKGDATKKSGDDYAARVYVIFPAFLFWRTKVLNYIWANKLKRGSILPNTYLASAAMIAVESGPQKARQWVVERRNIYLDYQKAFGEKPPDVGAIAIMTDTDNTGEKAAACYGPITRAAD